MSNTILTAKNTFGDGLVLDISPENTGANNLSSALNATLITANGNEMTLQNDMGNARVESAYLPDGYIPIGTCEFGDIIYIVSYNPLVNKALIGCFPSPERNISSEEISNIVQTLLASDFLILGEDGKPTGELKAMLVKKTLFDGKKLRPGDKYIVYTKDNTFEDAIDNPTNFFAFTSQYGAPSANDLLPRLVKLRIASMDSEGKLTYLDTLTKWYNERNTMEKYFIAFLQDSADRPDIDSYRDLTNSAYSVFLNKNAGNLVLIAELEKIDSFSCSYSVIKSLAQNEEGESSFNVYLHVSWDTPHNDINPFGIRVTGDAEGLGFENGIFEKSISRLYKPDIVKLEVDNLKNITYKPYSYEEYKNNNYESLLLTQLSWENDIPMNKISLVQTLNGDYFLSEEGLALYYPNLTKLSKENNEIIAYTTNSSGENIVIDPIAFSADVVNNYFKKDYTIHLASVSYANDALPIWNIMVYPCMPYGYLEHLGVPLTIDFSKVGTNSIELTHWKYYNDGLLSTLTYGFDMNLANNYKVGQVAFEFYDDRGLVAVYKSNEKTSYSGMFTERFGLNGENLNYKLSNTDLNGELIYHAGNLSSEGEVQLDKDGTSGIKPSLKPGLEVLSVSVEDVDKTYLNDSGILYNNKLYGVKIIVEYGVVNELGEMINSETKEFYRWYWTNKMFNDKYFQENDFNFDSLTLGLACNYVLLSTDDFKTKQVAYYNGNIGAGDGNLPLTLGADTTYIKGPMSLKLDVGLSKNYDTFIPSTNLLVDCKIGLGYKNIIQSYSEIASEEGTNIANTKRLTPNINLSDEGMWDNKGDVLLKLLGIEEVTNSVEIWNSPEEGNDKRYESQFVLTLDGDNTDSDKYMFNDVEHDVQYKREAVLTSGIQTDIELGLEGISFDKVMYSGTESIPKDYPIVESLWSSDVFKGMLGIKNGKYKDASNNEYDIHYFTDVLAITTPTDGNDGILKKCIYEDPISNPSITEHKDRQITTKNKNYQYNNSELLSAIDKLGFTGPLILLSWFAGSANDGKYDLESFAIDGHIINGNGGGYSLLPNIISGDTKSFFNNTGAFFQLALYKPNTYLYLLNDVVNYFTEENSENRLPQIPNIIKGFDENNSEKIEYKKANYYLGLADMLVKVFSNIYYKSYQTSEVILPKFTDLAYANNFKEIWNQHLILNINLSDKKIDYSDKINLLGSRKSNSEYYTVSDYIEKINTFTNVKMPNFEVLLALALLVIDCNIDVPSSKLLKTIYSRKTSEPQAVWFKNGDKNNPLYVYSNVNDTLFLESNGELTKLSKNFTYNISSEETATCDLSWIEYDPEIFIKVDNYPKGNYYRIGNGWTDDKKLKGYRYYENASKDATITGFWNVIK